MDVVTGTAPPPLPESTKSRKHWLPLGLLAFLPRTPALLSALVHGALLATLGFLTLNHRGRETQERVFLVVDPSANVSEDLFESNVWTPEPEPMINPPGGGPVRAALDPVAGDLAETPIADVSETGMANQGPANLLAGAEASGGGGGTGLGLDDGRGGGGGVGEGAAAFFGLRSKGRRFLFVIDRSLSMTENNAFDLARRELLRSLDQLAPNMEFQVLFYNDDFRTLNLSGRGLVRATPANKARARELIGEFIPAAGTDHIKAMRRALALRPDVIYLLTDADNIDPKDVEDLTRLNRRTRASDKSTTIHVVQFVHGRRNQESDTSRKLAEKNKGTFRVINTEVGLPEEETARRGP